MTTFRIEAIPADTVARIHATGRDEAGNVPQERIDAEGGSPLRCCLRDAEPGDGYPDVHDYPHAIGHRKQIVRGYDQDGNMATATIVADGHEAEQELNTILARPDIHVAHVRNVAAGCYNFAVWPTAK
jgi:hypothetical protein